MSILTWTWGRETRFPTRQGSIRGEIRDANAGRARSEDENRDSHLPRGHKNSHGFEERK